MSKKDAITVKDVNKQFIDSIKKVAKALDKDPYNVNKQEFVQNDPAEMSEWSLRRGGGFEALKKMFFSQPTEGGAPKHGAAIVNAFRNKLEKQYGTEKFIKDEVLAVLEETLKKYPIKLHAPITRSKKQSKGQTRTILAHLSDTHYGSNIDKEEMGGVNELNWKISARRTALFVDQICQYKLQHREDTDLVLAVNGDLVSGVIHNQEFFSDLWATQFSGALDIMVQAISYLATQFKNVRVEWTTGNHERAMHKSDKGRATTHKWDSLGSTIAVATKRVVESTHSNVKINVPITPYNIVEIQGHLFFITHGDTIFNPGNVGSSINMRSLNTQIAKLNASEIGGNRKFSGVLVGHVHTNTAQLTESGCMLLVNGALSGLDPYATSIGVFESHPSQQMFEVTKEYAVGDIRMVQLKAADTNSELDKIIKPFKGKLG